MDSPTPIVYILCQSEKFPRSELLTNEVTIKAPSRVNLLPPLMKKRVSILKPNINDVKAKRS
jgi:hypothetical protein